MARNSKRGFGLYEVEGVQEEVVRSSCPYRLLAEPNRTWAQVKDNFRELFLGSLGLLDDDIEGVKKAAANLTNTNKRLALKFSNIYSNNNIDELKEVLAILIPMVIDEVIKSQMKEVKFYGVNMLFEIIKSSTQERMY